ncbi:hypothetical protein AVDCRST_MAG94-685 [uncultured Leptolyngbya sp.]|uniref:Uncharacterized protein n=1 Tax=uncultured Leptolyngbya sp. TaxID=332963 RepID=A0A6J4KIN6_9CYAN|nr:hypothetical protein AVDCRST_MAG94-685 [uncultured Leptolyngbya sp.]
MSKDIATLEQYRKDQTYCGVWSSTRALKRATEHLTKIEEASRRGE